MSNTNTCIHMGLSPRVSAYYMSLFLLSSLEHDLSGKLEWSEHAR